MSRVMGVILAVGLVAGCKDDKFPQHERWDGPPFQIGDSVRLKAGGSSVWVVEGVENGRVKVVREPVVQHFWSGREKLPTQRDTYPEGILERRVNWWNNEPEPPHRQK